MEMLEGRRGVDIGQETIILIGGAQNVPDNDYFDDYPADDYGSVEGASRRSQSPEDYTACSSDGCGCCGHCSY
jgi:hypothetical protein